MEKEAAQLLADRLHGPQDIEFDLEHRVVALPDGWRVHDLKPSLPPPRRIQQRVELLALGAFTDYVGKFKGSETAIFADEEKARFEAVIDYHAAGMPPEINPRGHCDHVALYNCPLSDEWKIWLAHTGKPFNQVDFGRLIEDNLPDVVEPPAARLLEVVLKLSVLKSANFLSETRLDNGETKLRYEETIRDQSKQGDLAIPQEFTLAIPVFVDGDFYRLKARLRYRIDDQKLRLWYDLVRPEETRRDATKAVSADVVKALPDVPFFAGKRVG